MRKTQIFFYLQAKTHVYVEEYLEPYVLIFNAFSAFFRL